MSHRRKLLLLATVAEAFLLLAPMAGMAAKPTITAVWPDVPDCGAYRLIVGENFDSKSVEVYHWKIPRDGPRTAEAVKLLGRQSPRLPETPPPDAMRISLVDVEPTVIVCGNWLVGDIFWVKSSEGCSDPVLINVPKPFWLSDGKVEPGGVAHLYGFGLRAEYCENQIVLVNGERQIKAKPFVETRSFRTPDKRLVYFEVPADTSPGKYEVYVHNGYASEFGWVKAGALEVVVRPAAEPRTFDVTSYGARGDGLHNDLKAIQAAMAEAAEQGGVVFFPPGTFQLDETLLVPAGVTLRGAGRDVSILRGTGYDPRTDRVAWFTLPTSPPAAVVRLADHTALESLAVCGAVSQGVGGSAAVEAVPQTIAVPHGGSVSDVAIRNCRIRGQEEDLLARRTLYRSALSIGPNSQRISLLDNDIYGSVLFQYGKTARTEVIGNMIHGGAASDVVSLSANAIDSLFDANLLVDTPGRICVQPWRHCHVRYNEVRNAFRGTWANAEELFLVHGGGEKIVGLVSAAAGDSLSDTRQRWAADQWADQTVLIIAGRGFGQYRTVTGNTENSLRVDRPWRVVPDATSQYAVGRMFTDSSFFANCNATPGRMSLWLDCIGCVVDMHRDEFGGGLDLWGSDGSSAKKPPEPGRGVTFCPAWFNVIQNCWLDGSTLHLFHSPHPDNLVGASVMFGNFAVRNIVRQAHAKRTGFNRYPPAEGAIRVGNISKTTADKPQSACSGLSHNIVAENDVSFTGAGIVVSDFARKTLLLGNSFQEVEHPILDWGAQTIARSNRVQQFDAQGQRETELPEITGQRAMRAPSPAVPLWPEPPAKPPVWPSLGDLHVLISQPVYCFYSGASDAAVERQCEENLKQLHGLIQQHVAKQGTLPKAAFFPENPASDADSLAVVLGEDSRRWLVCPTCSLDFRRLGLTYVWNEKLSGKKPAEIPDPANTWLVMDFVAVHPWMVTNRSCGHRGGVLALYVDGTVRWTEPPTREAWREWEKP